jgi:asparaginyl-tRNA synthetase
MDILVPGIGEIIGGSQREERYDVLRSKCAQFHVPEESIWWYLDTRRFGTCVHAGFGLGFERLVMYVTGMTNIRDVIPFPRTPGSAEF